MEPDIHSTATKKYERDSRMSDGAWSMRDSQNAICLRQRNTWWILTCLRSFSFRVHNEVLLMQFPYFIRLKSNKPNEHGGWTFATHEPTDQTDHCLSIRLMVISFAFGEFSNAKHKLESSASRQVWTGKHDLCFDGVDGCHGAATTATQSKVPREIFIIRIW